MMAKAISHKKNKDKTQNHFTCSDENILISTHEMMKVVKHAKSTMDTLCSNYKRKFDALGDQLNRSAKQLESDFVRFRFFKN